MQASDIASTSAVPMDSAQPNAGAGAAGDGLGWVEPPAGLSLQQVHYLVRHGETEENRQGVMQGQLDTPLNAAGVGQAYLTARVLKTKKFGRAHASDLERAVKVCGLLHMISGVAV